MAWRVDAARRLRREQTDAERVLWFRLRDRRLNGLKLRFWNDDVLRNIDGVLGEIVGTLKPHPPHPNPLPNGEREQA